MLVWKAEGGGVGDSKGWLGVARPALFCLGRLSIPPYLHTCPSLDLDPAASSFGSGL